MKIKKVHAYLETPLFVLLGVCTCEDRLGRPSRRCGWNRIDTIAQASLRLVGTDCMSPMQFDILMIYLDAFWHGDHIGLLSEAFGYVHLISFDIIYIIACVIQVHQIYWPLHSFFSELHRTWCLHMYHVPSATRWRWCCSSVSLGLLIQFNLLGTNISPI